MGCDDLTSPAADADTAAAAFSRKNEFREAARKSLMATTCRAKLQAALRARPHSDRFYAPGQWVYVWRRAAGRNRTHALQRDRWTGPGAVVWQQGGTVWVAMRTKLWKCSSEQVRLATHPESLGAELLDEPGFRALQEELNQPGWRFGAVDVAAGGPPPSTAWGHQPAEQRYPGPLEPAAPEPHEASEPTAPPSTADDSLSEPAASSASSAASDVEPPVRATRRRPLETVPEEPAETLTPAERLPGGDGRVARLRTQYEQLTRPDEQGTQDDEELPPVDNDDATDDLWQEPTDDDGQDDALLDTLRHRTPQGPAAEALLTLFGTSFLTDRPRPPPSNRKRATQSSSRA